MLRVLRLLTLDKYVPSVSLIGRVVAKNRRTIELAGLNNNTVGFENLKNFKFSITSHKKLTRFYMGGGHVFVDVCGLVRVRPFWV